MHCNHTVNTIAYDHLIATLYADSKQVAFAVRIIAFNKIRQLCAHARATHIRRIRHHRMVLLRQRLPLRNHQPKLRLRRLNAGFVKRHLLFRRGVRHKARQQRPVVFAGLQNGAVFLRVNEFVQQRVHPIEGIVPFKGTQTMPQIIQVFALDEIALLDGINVRLHFLGEETAVILPGFHHHGKIR